MPIKQNFSRICIFGRPGSGKSTFALQLNKKTGLPLFHLDRFFYVSNWVERDYDEFLQIQQTLVCQDRWIIDGNSLQSLGVRYSKAELVLYFNYPAWLCTLRVIKRIFTKNDAIKDRAEGCPEKISWSLISYLWTFETRKSCQLLSDIGRLRPKHPDVPFFEIRTKKDLEKARKFFD